MKFTSAILLGCCLLSSLACAQDNGKSPTEIPANTVRLVIEKDDNNNFNIFNFDANGQKELLTLGTFLRASAQVVLGKQIAECDKSTPLVLFYETDEHGNLVTSLVDADGQKKRLLFKGLLTSLPGTLYCGSTKTDAKTDVKADSSVQVFLEKNSTGNVQTFIVHPDGRKEPLEFGNLLTASAELLKNCKLGTENNRSVYIAFEKNADINPKTRSADKYPPDVLQAIQIDAYGLKEELNLDNLINAAAQTLQVCEHNKNKALAPIPKGPVIQIKFENDSSNHLSAYLIDTKGTKKDLTFGTLISAAAGISPCKFAPKTHDIDVVFQKDSNGNFKPYVITAKGDKVDFNLIGHLMITAYTLCANEKVK